jgi:hypothetical protein
MAIRVLSGVRWSGAGRAVEKVLNRYPGSHAPLYITSSYRPYDTGSHHGYGNAVDIASAYPSNPGPMKDVARWLYQYSGYLTELIHTNGNYFVKNGSRVGKSFYGSKTRANHWNHVHVAMTSAQANRLLGILGAGGGGGGGGSSSGSCITSVRGIKSQQKAVNNAGYSPKLAEDGICGPKTTAGVKWLQGKIGADKDGKWGPDTEKKYVAKYGPKGGGSTKPSPSGKISEDGVKGSQTIAAMQKVLNSKR